MAHLPYDVARCSGYELDNGKWHENCEDCLRRTNRDNFPQQVWMDPLAAIDLQCEYRIRTGKGIEEESNARHGTT